MGILGFLMALFVGFLLVTKGFFVTIKILVAAVIIIAGLILLRVIWSGMPLKTLWETIPEVAKANKAIFWDGDGDGDSL
ncbi:hypothetical protein A3A84_00315 [Candidatus Collierbacteria bacterium RIFCSPLOWO2_01_FULL_50_23]|nr:MAG: hypothetical protein A3A84_00315 [Candidatus Collierbacteria bacterium RIFCSPLOWO2_01_FULL_50_23]